MPYTSCDRLTSTLTFNKYYTNSFLKSKEIKSAASVLVRSIKEVTVEEIISEFNLPCFVKPNNGGSSFGITKVKKEVELIPALEKAFKEDSEVIIEQFILVKF